MRDSRCVFFDLDGVLVDSRPGIVSCVLRTLKEFSYAAVSVERVEGIIGPPLHCGFTKLIEEQSGSADDVEPCVRRYRELYSEVVTSGGTTLQPGVHAMLDDLAPHATLAVATSKPLRFSEAILMTLNIRSYFAAVAGPEPPLEVESKTDTLRRAMRVVARAGVRDYGTDRSWMVGDRSHDVVAALACGITPVGVTWGFGSEAELRDAGALEILRLPSELKPLIVIADE